MDDIPPPPDEPKLSDKLDAAKKFHRVGEKFIDEILMIIYEPFGVVLISDSEDRRVQGEGREVVIPCTTTGAVTVAVLSNGLTTSTGEMAAQRGDLFG